MPKVLVVEDSATQLAQFQGILRKGEFDVHGARHGREALQLIASEHPDIVLTDLQMPELDGLGLVEAIRQTYPSLPVVLMTAHGTDEIAVQALRKGAASYVPKHRIAQDILATLRDVLEVAQSRRDQQRVYEYVTRTESNYTIDNEASLISPLMAHFEEELSRIGLSDKTEIIRVLVALRESLENAIYHGNLEVSSALREDDGLAYYELAAQRRQEIPYRDRRVHICAELSRSEVVYTVTDEGPGFDPSGLPDPTDPANLERPSGRGLMLIRTFMDEVTHNPTGNQIRMVKRRPGPLSNGSSTGASGQATA